jgi:hypothetical protein
MRWSSRAGFATRRWPLELETTTDFRFLLDQNFPKPVFDVHSLDARVEYVHLHDFDARLAKDTTPDWMIYLIAAAAGFTGVVTRDRSQLEQDEELVALTCTKLSVVTWRRSVEDAVTEWGQLLAYMPLVIRSIAQKGPRVFLLPEPRLDASSVERAEAVARKHASDQRTSYPELRARALPVMDRYLTYRKRSDLRRLLQ